MTICIDMGATEIKVAPIKKNENEIVNNKIVYIFFILGSRLGNDNM